MLGIFYILSTCGGLNTGSINLQYKRVLPFMKNILGVSVLSQIEVSHLIDQGVEEEQGVIIDFLQRKPF